MIQDIVPHARRIGRPVYWRPYPKNFNQGEFPRGFKVLEFALFSGDGLQSTIEHIDRFMTQCAKIGHREALKLRLKPDVLISNLAKISQGPYESVPEYLGKFRKARVRCTVNMLEHEFAKLAQGGLSHDLRKKFKGIEFRDIYDLLLQVD
ncbi:hypothetical protein L3X38_004479 [Prunus dulcis]|uniref:Uncharacterized protein n=1 Tax=Prunus dulcis TaxID=3755 RepID=A0AAD5F3B6_PRUDU|nr:hypothetical protein L3X38_004479 [Prunus dulcis]